MPNKFEELGLIAPTPSEQPRRMVCTVSGFEKSGKSHFALTAPAPIAYFNLDAGLEGVVEPFVAAGKEVYIKNFRISREDTQEEWQSQWTDFMFTLDAAYRAGAGTVVVDTLTEAYELSRLAHFGKLEQVMPNRYAPVNRQFRAVLRSAYDAKETHTIYLQQMDIGFESKVPEPKGWRQTPYLVQSNLETSKEPNPAGQGLDIYSIRVRDSRTNPHSVGMMLSGERCTWDEFQWLQFDWRPE